MTHLTKMITLTDETDPTISARFRIPTEKGMYFKVQVLKQSRMVALSTVSRKRKEKIRMMSDQNNIDLIRNELTTFDTLCQRCQEEHKNLYQALETLEEKDQSSLAFSLKDSESFEFRKQVVHCNWLTVGEQRINDQLDKILEQRSRASHSSRLSRSSSRSHAFKRSRLSAAEERAKVAELQQAEEQLNLELKIAKSQPRDKVFTELEREENDHSPKRDDAFGEISSEMNGAVPPGLAASPSGVTRGKATPGRSHLHGASPEFYYRAVPDEVKTKVKEEAHSSQRSDEELLKEIFIVQYEQLQAMISSQKQLATAVTLPQPEVPKFGGDPTKYKTFIIAFDVAYRQE